MLNIFRNVALFVRSDFRDVNDLGKIYDMRHSQRGDTIFNCLLVMVLVLGTVLWAWTKFGAHHGIMQGGKPDSIVVDRSGNREALLRYQARMRERYFGTSEQAVTKAQELVAQAGQKKYAEDRAAFEQRFAEVVRGLEDNLAEVNANTVPATFEEGHLRLGAAHKLAYEALVMTHLALSEEPELQKKRYREAGDDARRAVAQVREARQSMAPRFR